MRPYPQTFSQFKERLSEALENSILFFRTRQVIGLATIDHIGWTCADSNEYDTLRELLEKEHSDFIFQSIISGRRIAIIKFKQPIETPIGLLRYLELADHKPSKDPSSGFDHIEACPAEGITYTELVSMLSSRTMVRTVTRPHHTTHEASIHDTMRFCCSTEPLIAKIMRDQMP